MKPETNPLAQQLLINLLVVLLFVSSAMAANDSNAPDLRLDWPGAKAIAGRDQEKLTLRYRVLNHGSRDAFAVIVESFTNGKTIHHNHRFEPGPRKGQSIRGDLTITLTLDLKEICLEAKLQTLRVDDPIDPNPQDNRVCRPVSVESSTDRSTAHQQEVLP